MYRSEYQGKLTTAEKVFETLSSGQTIVHGMACAEPPALLEALAAKIREGNLKDIVIYSLLPLEYACRTVLAPELSDRVHALSWFVSGNDRDMIRSGVQRFVPNYFHQIPRFCREIMKIDWTITTVSPMDRAGYFSFGTANDFTSTAARHCGKLVVEVNRHMPRVYGDSLLHVSEVSGIIENDRPLIEVSYADPRPEAEKIGEIIAEMVPDGATLQLGVGAIPNAVTGALGNHKDLGIHTEIFVPGMVDLIKRGVVTGKRKTLHPMKHVFTSAQGNKEMFDLMNDNPSMESYPVSYTNEPAVIAQNDRMISVNSCLQVDLFGQANAEFLHGHEYSGTGGQLDFVRGAYNSRDGKSFIAFYSTVKNGSISRIVPRFEEGTIVTTPRMDTHYLVTEYGAVNLKGKSTTRRALDIIGIAHPKFRDELAREGVKMGILPASGVKY